MTKKLVIGIKQSRQIKIVREPKAFSESTESRVRRPSYIERLWTKAQDWAAVERPDHYPAPVLTREAMAVLRRPMLTAEAMAVLAAERGEYVSNNHSRS